MMHHAQLLTTWEINSEKQFFFVSEMEITFVGHLHAFHVVDKFHNVFAITPYG